MTMKFPVMPPGFTRAERKIAEYISAHTEAFLFMGIAQLSETLQLSEATISRFARHVGCSDFKELKKVVMDQAALQGPAAKVAGTLLGEEEDFLARWIRRQQLYLEKRGTGPGRIRPGRGGSGRCRKRLYSREKCFRLSGRSADVPAAEAGHTGEPHSFRRNGNF